MSARRGTPRAGGFTLVEVAVTIVIVGIGLTLVLQALSAAKLTASHTRNQKIARDLGLLTLGRIESGIYREEIRDRFGGSYAEEGYPQFYFEVALGDEAFVEQADREADDSPFYDSWNSDRDDEGEDDETTEPYEDIKVKVSFPEQADTKNYLILQGRAPWEQVYGPDEDEEDAAAAGSDDGGSTP